MTNQGPNVQRQNQALSRVDDERDKLAKLPGSYRNAQEITGRLQYAAEHFNLVSPATACGALPEGCSVALSTVWIDEADTYNVQGKFGLSKSALDKIAAGAGVCWDATQSGRLDDGSHPYYCRWKAVGTYRHLDGTEVQIIGEKEMDLREGSAQVDRMRASAKTAETFATQLRDTRAFLQGHAETKARLRAIRSIGLRTSYTKEDLKKPFVVARLMWTGQSDDPELRREFARMQATAMLGGSRALYGHQPAAPAAATPARTLLSPPPVGATKADGDDFGAGASTPPRAQGQVIDAPQGTGSEAAQNGTTRPSASSSGGGSGLFMPGKKGAPKVTVRDAEDKDLNYWNDRLAKSLDDGSSNYPEKDRDLLVAIRAEIALRSSGGEVAGDKGAPKQHGLPIDDGDPSYAGRGDSADDY